MQSNKPPNRPPCNSLLWVVLLVCILLILKKYVAVDNIWNFSDKNWGLFIGFGIVLFGLVTAWLRKNSDHVV
jgi:hypothetical protein